MSRKLGLIAVLLLTCLLTTSCRFALFGGKDDDGDVVPVDSSVGFGEELYREILDMYQGGHAVIALQAEAEAQTFYRFDLLNPKGARILSTIFSYEEALATPTFGTVSTARAVLYDLMKSRTGTTFNYFDFSKSLDAGQVNRVASAIEEVFADLDYLTGSEIDIASYPVVAVAAAEVLTGLTAPEASDFAPVPVYASAPTISFRADFPTLKPETIGGIVFNLEAQKFISDIYTKGLADSPYVKANTPLRDSIANSIRAEQADVVNPPFASSGYWSVSAGNSNYHERFFRQLRKGSISLPNVAWILGKTPAGPTVSSAQTPEGRLVTVFLPDLPATSTSLVRLNVFTTDYFVNVSCYHMSYVFKEHSEYELKLTVTADASLPAQYDCRVLVDGVERTAVRLARGQTSTFLADIPDGKAAILRVYGPPRQLLVDQLKRQFAETVSRVKFWTAQEIEAKDVGKRSAPPAPATPWTTATETAIVYEDPTQAGEELIKVFPDLEIPLPGQAATVIASAPRPAAVEFPDSSDPATRTLLLVKGSDFMTGATVFIDPGQPPMASVQGPESGAPALSIRAAVPATAKAIAVESVTQSQITCRVNLEEFAPGPFFLYVKNPDSQYAGISSPVPMPVAPVYETSFAPTGLTGPVDRLVLTFSEPMVASGGVIYILRQADQIPVEGIPVTDPQKVRIDGNTITVFCTMALQKASTKYVVDIPRGAFRTTAGWPYVGSRLSSAFRWAFETGAGSITAFTPPTNGNTAASLIQIALDKAYPLDRAKGRGQIRIKDAATGEVLQTIEASSADGYRMDAREPWKLNISLNPSGTNRTMFVEIDDGFMKVFPVPLSGIFNPQTWRFYHRSVANDTQSPVPGNGGAIRVMTWLGTSGISPTSVSLAWEAATDNMTPSGSLQYLLFRSAANRLSTIADLWANGTPVGTWTMGMTASNVVGLNPETTYWFNVLVADEAGRQAVYTPFQAVTTTVPDTIPPTVVEVIPASSARQLPPDSRITITFSEPMDEATINLSNISITDAYSLKPVPGTLTFDRLGKRVATFTPTTTISTYGSSGRVKISTGVKDLAGNALRTAIDYYLSLQDPPISFLIAPDGGFVAIGQTVKLTATAVFSGGRREDLTAKARWTATSAEAKDYAVFDAPGVLRGVASGSMVVKAAYAGAETKATIFRVDLDPAVYPPTLRSGYETPLVRDLAHSSLTLAWEGATDNRTPTADLRYLMFRSSANNLDTVANTLANGTPIGTWTRGMTASNVVGLTPNTSYWFNVLVMDQEGNKTAYRSVQTRTSLPPDPIPPTVGGGGVITFTEARENNRLPMSWTAATDNMTPSANLQYHLYYSTRVPLTNTNTLSLGTPIGTWTTGMTSTVLTPPPEWGTTYWYNVVVRDEIGNISAYNGQQTPSWAAVPPTVGAGGITASSITTTTARLSWAAASDNFTPPERLRYLLYRLDNVWQVADTMENIVAKGIPIGTWTAGMTATTAVGLNPGSFHYFNVLVMDEAGHQSFYPRLEVRTADPPDLTPPTVTSVVPAEGATNVPVNTQITVNFSELMNRQTLTTSTIKVFQGTTPIAGTVDASILGKTATFIPSVPLNGDSIITVTVTTGGKGAAGGARAAPKEWTFRTVVTDPPASLDLTPTGGFVAIGKTANLAAAAVYPDGRRTDVTAQAVWSSSNTAVATFSAAGTLRGVSAGTVTVTVTFGGQSKTGSFQVGAAGYVPETVTYNWEDISTTGSELLPAGYSDQDDKSYTIALPFTFTFFGTPYTACYPSDNGLITFGSGYTGFSNSDIPNAAAPNNFIAPLFRDLKFWASSGGKLRYQTMGTSPSRRLIIQWHNVNDYNVTGTNVFTFQVILYEGSNDIRFQYQDVVVGSADYDYGKAATVGLENAAGTIGSKYSFAEPKLANGQAILFRYQTQ